MSDGEYSRLYNNLPYLLLEDVGFPGNFNLLSQQQLAFFSTVVDVTVERYADSYIDLLESFREDLSSLSNQAKEVISELEK